MWVSYGTTKLDLPKREMLDLVIQNNRRMMDLDLPMATRFNLDFANWLPWCSEFFAPPAHSNYMVAGSLDENEKTLLRALLKMRGIIQEL